MCEIHLNDYGTDIEVTIKNCDGSIVDISNASLQIVLVPPTDSPPIIAPMVFSTDGTDGMAYYTIQEGDINMTGTWELQVRIQFVSSFYNTSIGKLKVLRNIG